MTILASLERGDPGMACALCSVLLAMGVGLAVLRRTLAGAGSVMMTKGVAA